MAKSKKNNPSDALSKLLERTCSAQGKVGDVVRRAEGVLNVLNQAVAALEQVLQHNGAAPSAPAKSPARRRTTATSSRGDGAADAPKATAKRRTAKRRSAKPAAAKPAGDDAPSEAPTLTIKRAPARRTSTRRRTTR